MRQRRGFTLMEMITTLAVISVLAAITAPGFARLRLDAERTQAVNGLFHALFLARSEAIKRGAIVSVCGSADAEQCSSAGEDWTGGWIVFVNADGDEPARRDHGEALLAAHGGWPSGRMTSNRRTYSFRAYRQGVVNGTILFCDPRGPAHSRAIVISQTGRPRIARTGTRGGPLRCPSAQG